MTKIDKGVNVNANLNIHDNQNENLKARPQKERTDYTSSIRSVTSEQLIAAMGGRGPKSDIKVFGHVFERSTEYKKVLNDLDQFKAAFNELANSPIQNLTKQNIDILKSNLEDAYNHAAEYQKAHAKDSSKADRRNAMETLKGALTQQMDALDDLLRNKAGDFPKGTTVGMVSAIRSGVETPSLISFPHKEDKLLGDPTPLGSGAMNTVFLAKWQKPDDTIETRVLKPLSAGLPEGARMPDLSGLLGLTNDHMLVAERNVATGKVAGHLGLSHIAPTGNIIVLNNQAYLEMPVAPGKSAKTEVLINLPEDHPTTSLFRSIENDPNMADSIALAHCVKVGENQNGESLFAKKDTTYFDFPFTSDVPNDITAGLQEGLLDLQLLDALTGQGDRNAGNIFIDVTDGKVSVTGIDHDLSFSSAAGNDISDFTPPPPRGFSGQFTGLPPIMTQKSFDKLMSIDRLQYKADLSSSGLNDQQVALAMTRFDKVRDHAITLKEGGQVLLSLTDNVLNPETQEMQSPSEYLMSKQGTSYVEVFARQMANTVSDGLALVPYK